MVGLWEAEESMSAADNEMKGVKESEDVLHVADYAAGGGK